MFPRRGMQDWWQYDGFERNDELKITSKHNKKKQTIKYKDKNKQGKSEKKVEKNEETYLGVRCFIASGDIPLFRWALCVSIPFQRSNDDCHFRMKARHPTQIIFSREADNTFQLKNNTRRYACLPLILRYEGVSMVPNYLEQTQENSRCVNQTLLSTAPYILSPIASYMIRLYQSLGFSL